MYQLIDTHTNRVVRTNKNAQPLRNERDRLDAKYGAVRYVVRPV